MIAYVAAGIGGFYKEAVLTVGVSLHALPYSDALANRKSPCPK
jgi:hypothetical protein